MEELRQLLPPAPPPHLIPAAGAEEANPADLVEKFLPLMRRLSAQVARKTGEPEPDFYLGAAFEGLRETAAKYPLSHPFFQRLLEKCIRQRILDQQRRESPLSDTLYGKLKILRETQEKLWHEGILQPTRKQLAETSGLPEKSVLRLLEIAGPELRAPGRRFRPGEEPATTSGFPEESGSFAWELFERYKGILFLNERIVLEKRYFVPEPKTMEQIAEDLGVSTSGVNYIHATAIEKLRRATQARHPPLLVQGGYDGLARLIQRHGGIPLEGLPAGSPLRQLRDVSKYFNEEGGIYLLSRHIEEAIQGNFLLFRKRGSKISPEKLCEALSAVMPEIKGNLHGPRMGWRKYYQSRGAAPSDAAAGELFSGAEEKTLFLAAKSEEDRYRSLLNWMLDNPASLAQWLETEVDPENLLASLHLLEFILEPDEEDLSPKNLRSRFRPILDRIYKKQEWPTSAFPSLRGKTPLRYRLLIQENETWADSIKEVLLYKDPDYPSALKKLRGKGWEKTVERTVEALRRVPRHLFLPQYCQPVAHEDRGCPIGYNQTISMPSLVAFLLAVLDLRKQERVLEVGAGSGWFAALAAQMAKEVDAVEKIPALAKRARRTLAKLGVSNATVRTASRQALGNPQGAPYDVIVVSAGSREIPQELIDQLAMGGRMIIPVYSEEQSKIHRQTCYSLQLLRKSRKGIRETVLIPVTFFVPLKTTSAAGAEEKKENKKRGPSRRDFLKFGPAAAIAGPAESAIARAAINGEELNGLALLERFYREWTAYLSTEQTGSAGDFSRPPFANEWILVPERLAQLRNETAPVLERLGAEDPLTQMVQKGEREFKEALSKTENHRDLSIAVREPDRLLLWRHLAVVTARLRRALGMENLSQEDEFERTKQAGLNDGASYDADVNDRYIIPTIRELAQKAAGKLQEWGVGKNPIGDSEAEADHYREVVFTERSNRWTAKQYFDYWVRQRRLKAWERLQKKMSERLKDQFGDSAQTGEDSFSYWGEEAPRETVRVFYRNSVEKSLRYRLKQKVWKALDRQRRTGAEIPDKTYQAEMDRIAEMPAEDLRRTRIADYVGELKQRHPAPHPLERLRQLQEMSSVPQLSPPRALPRDPLRRLAQTLEFAARNHPADLRIGAGPNGSLSEVSWKTLQGPQDLHRELLLSEEELRELQFGMVRGQSNPWGNRAQAGVRYRIVIPAETHAAAIYTVLTEETWWAQEPRGGVVFAKASWPILLPTPAAGTEESLERLGLPAAQSDAVGQELLSAGGLDQAA